MKRTFFFKKAIISFIALILLFLNTFAHAGELPIDPDTITGQRDPRQEALTTRSGIDLFSEEADETTERLVILLDEKLTAAQKTLFNEPFNPQIYAPEARITQSVSEAGLFAEPMRFGSTAQQEVDESGVPLWITIIVLVAAFAVGLFIAIKTSPRRKERS